MFWLFISVVVNFYCMVHIAWIPLYIQFLVLIHTNMHTFNGPLSETTWVSRYQKGKTNRDFTEARDNEWQWHQLGHMQVCTSLQTDKHASTPPLSLLQAGCPSCHPANSIKALKAAKSTPNAQQIKVIECNAYAYHGICYIWPDMEARQTTVCLDSIRHTLLVFFSQNSWTNGADSQHTYYQLIYALLKGILLNEMNPD